MRKILSIFATMLFAGSMMADSFVLVTDASSLAANDEIIIVNTNADKAISTTQNTNNRAATDVEVVSDAITPSASVQIITLEASGANWKFKVGDDQYLYAAGNDKNYLKTAASATAGDNGVWKVEITSAGVATLTAQGTNARNVMRYNPNEQNNNPLFSCYGSSSTTGTLVSIYKKSTVAPAVLKPTFTPAAGTYHSTQNVTIACATEGAEIHYTLDGTDPLPTDKKYTEPIVLSVDGDYTIKAIAIKGEDKSAVAEAKYTIAWPKKYLSFGDLVADASAVDKLVSVAFADIKLTGVYVNKEGKFRGVYIDVEGSDGELLEIYCKTVEVPAAWGLGGKISGDIVGVWKYYDESQWEVEIDDWSGVTTYVAPAVEAPRMTPLSESFYNELEVTITCPTEGAKIYYTLDESAPTAESAEYTAPIKLKSKTVVRAIAIKGDDKSEIAYKQYTKAEVMTVEAAFDALDKSTPINNVYVAGIVSKVDSYNSTYGSITYWISDDGKTEGKQLQVYGGLGLEGKKFTKKEDLKVGDKVTIYGNLKIYSGTKEFDLNNILVEYESGVATAIENEAVEMKVIKYFENGQLIIEKNGVKYNAQGAIVK